MERVEHGQGGEETSGNGSQQTKQGTARHERVKRERPTKLLRLQSCFQEDGCCSLVVVLIAIQVDPVEFEVQRFTQTVVSGRGKNTRNSR